VIRLLLDQGLPRSTVELLRADGWDVVHACQCDLSTARDEQAQLARRHSEALRILMLDDDLLLLKSLRDTLEAEGHEVVVADGGQAGIDRLSELREALANLTGS
jgi:PleD family two-component response regulator